MRAAIKGSLPAWSTPFKNGAVDFDGLKTAGGLAHCRRVARLVPVGTTGESPTLSHDEHEAVIAAVCEGRAGRVPVVAGAGSNNTTEGIRLIRFAEKAGRMPRWW